MTDRPLSSALAGRYSPLRFDTAHRLSSDTIDVLLEAARWAPSAGNSQPWAFHARRRDEPGHDALVERLAGSARSWAPDASALVVNLAHRFVDDSDLEYSEFADYDLGQAVAHLTIQAHTMGLACRQFRAFDRDGLHAQIGVGPGWAIVSMLAVGQAASPAPESRARRPVRDLLTGWQADPTER